MSYFKYTYDKDYNYNLGKNGIVIKDIVYNTLSEKNKLDIYLPTIKRESYPVIVYIHGGGFVQGDKTHHIAGLLQGLQRGYAVACINYRLGEEAPYPAYLEDVCEGLRFLKSHSEEYHLDKEKFALWGDTHGGYIASYTAIEGPKGNLDYLPTQYPQENFDFCGVVSFYGPMNLSDYYESQIKSNHYFQLSDGRITDELVFEKKGQELVEFLKTLNPLDDIDGTEPPFYLLHGRLDFHINQQNTQDFSDKLTAKNVKHILDFIEEGIHSIDFYEDEKYNEPIMKFFDECFKL